MEIAMIGKTNPKYNRNFIKKDGKIKPGRRFAKDIEALATRLKARVSASLLQETRPWKNFARRAVSAGWRRAFCRTSVSPRNIGITQAGRYSIGNTVGSVEPNLLLSGLTSKRRISVWNTNFVPFVAWRKRSSGRVVLTRQFCNNIFCLFFKQINMLVLCW